MKLLTKEIIKKLPKLYSQEHNPDPLCVVKFFTPWNGWTWFATEGEEETYENGTKDWRFFGKVVSPMEPEGELGYFVLSELEDIKGPWGLKIERDMHFENVPLSKCK